MNTSVTLPFRGLPAGRMALAGIVVLTAGCASGGGTPTVVGAEAEAALAVLAGDWLLDEATSTPQIEMPPVTASSAGASPFQAAARQQAAFSVFMDRSGRLTLRVDGDKLTYIPAAGEKMEVPTNGKAVTRHVNRQILRTRIFWEEGRLGLEHNVDAWRVRETMDLVGGRLEVTRTIRITGRTWPAVVLRYDRDEGK